MKPVIGINGDVKTDPELSIRVKFNYIDAVRRAGGVPLVLPATSPEDLPYLLKRVDALILTGGGDIDVRPLGTQLHPSVQLMHPRRQDFDWALSRAVLGGAIPTLGICLGMQMLAVVGGGKIIQHLPDAGYENMLDHRGWHDVNITNGSRLAAIVGNVKLNVVSHHHQGIERVPEGFRVVATAPDGVMEAFEATDGRFILGLQWHPERDPQAPETQHIFRALVETALARRT